VLALRVDRVRRYPGGRWLQIDPRTVELGVPLGVTLPPALEQASAGKLRSVAKPKAVTAFTLKANTTPAAIVGAPGELLLSRVSLS
jgi:hypothetical protein